MYQLAVEAGMSDFSVHHIIKDVNWMQKIASP